MAQCRVCHYALFLVGDDLDHIGFHLLVVALDNRFHTGFVRGVVLEIGEYGYRLVTVGFCFDFFTVNDNLGIKYLLVYALVDVVTNCAYEHSLCQSGNLARRDKTVHLRVDGVAHILTVYRDRLPFLENFAETL